MGNDLHTALSSLKIDRSQRASGRGWWLAGVATVLVVATGAALAVAKPYLEAALLTTPVATTVITVSSPIETSTQFSASGYARTDAISSVSPRVSGVVSNVYVRQGEHVKARQLMYELDPTLQTASIDTSVSEGRAASGKAAGARARANVAASKLEELVLRERRQRRLAEAGVSPAQLADDLAAQIESEKKEVLVAQMDAQAAVSQVEVAESRTLEMRKRRSNLRVHSPISGTVLGKPPRVGEFVDPQGHGALRVADLSQLCIEVDVPEAKLGSVRPSAPALIALDAYPDKRFRGEVREVLPEVDRGKATVLVRVAFIDDNAGVLPEMAARVSFLSQAQDELAIHERPKKMIPSAAVVKRHDAQVVFVVESSRVRMLKVELGPKVGTSYELIDGPPVGTVLVMDPPPALKSGSRIRVGE